LGSKKTTFPSRFRMSQFRSLFLDELNICPQNLMPTQGVELEKIINFHKGIC
jgi:hypothetical protein